MIETALVLSFAANIALGVLLYFSGKEKIKIAPEARQDVSEALRLMEDLRRIGGGLVEIRRISPNDVFIRGSK